MAFVEFGSLDGGAVGGHCFCKTRISWWQRPGIFVQIFLTWWLDVGRKPNGMLSDKLPASRGVHPGKLTAGTWKSPVWKGKSSSKPPFLGSMLIFRGVLLHDPRFLEFVFWGSGSLIWMGYYSWNVAKGTQCQPTHSLGMPWTKISWDTWGFCFGVLAICGWSLLPYWCICARVQTPIISIFFWGWPSTQ